MNLYFQSGKVFFPYLEVLAVGGFLVLERCLLHGLYIELFKPCCITLEQPGTKSDVMANNPQNN